MNLLNKDVNTLTHENNITFFGASENLGELLYVVKSRYFAGLSKNSSTPRKGVYRVCYKAYFFNPSHQCLGQIGFGRDSGPAKDFTTCITTKSKADMLHTLKSYGFVISDIPYSRPHLSLDGKILSASKTENFQVSKSKQDIIR